MKKTIEVLWKEEFELFESLQSISHYIKGETSCLQDTLPNRSHSFRVRIQKSVLVVVLLRGGSGGLNGDALLLKLQEGSVRQVAARKEKIL